jgi:hypothetical protein
MDYLGLEPEPEPKPKPNYHPDLGSHNEDLSKKFKKSDCGGFAFREPNILNVTPQELTKRGCKMVKPNEVCKAPTPRRVILYFAIDKNGNPIQNGIHVIAQQCGSETYEHQAGISGPVFDGIKDPTKAVYTYLKILIDGKKIPTPSKVMPIHFCCPCLKKKKGGE